MNRDSRKPVNKWLVTLSISFGTLMGAIDTSIVNVALPHIRGAVGATVQEITWISTGYAVALVLVMPLTAFLSRLFGQKRVYMSCLVIFLVGSALCGTAGSLTTLVIYRAIQGFGAGALQPTEQAILRQTFPPKEQGMAMALFAMAVMLGPAVGPTLGGYIVDQTHWSWIFFINLPVGVVGLLMVWRFVHEDPELVARGAELAARQRKNIDWAGIALLSVCLSSIEYVLEEGGRNDWFDSSLITGLSFLAVVTLAFFIVRELTATAPAVNIRLFKDPTFASGTVIGGLMFAMLLANMFLLPIFMQELLGFTATQSGIALMPRTLVMMLAVPLVGRFYRRLDPRMTIAAGVVFFTYGAWDMSRLNLDSTSGDIVAALAIQGIGFACLFVPLTTVALSRVRRELIPDATGMNSLVRQLGGAVGLAIFATLLDHDSRIAADTLKTHLADTSPLVQQRLAMVQAGLVGRGLDPGSAKAAALGSLARSSAVQGSVIAFDRMFLLAGILFLLVLPLLYFLKVDRKSLTSEVHLD